LTGMCIAFDPELRSSMCYHLQGQTTCNAYKTPTKRQTRVAIPALEELVQWIVPHMGRMSRRGDDDGSASNAGYNNGHVTTGTLRQPEGMILMG
jgi:hypothetical protein